MKTKFQWMKFTVKRSNWLRGEGSGESKLLRGSDGKMCCLGFLSLSCGLSKEDIIDVSQPSEIESCGQGSVPPNLNSLPDGIYHGYDADDDYHGDGNDRTPMTCMRIMETNDSLALNGPEREAQLSELFSTINIEVVFED